ncbi:hypothetical protein D0Z03_002813 [Geotrichum reessii]|nr:hypothetical protein D0Z03_002813 [Galactomyces reessii]
MKTFIVTIFSAVLFLAACAHANFYDSASSPVVPFNPSSAKDQRRPQLTITEFYAPWCGHCQRLTPEYLKAAKRLAGSVRFAAVNCDAAENKGLCGRYQIQGYPTLKVFDHGRGSGEDYTGPREAKGLVRYMTDRLKSLTSNKVRIVKNTSSFERFVVAPPEPDPVSESGAPKKRVVLLAGKKAEVPLLYRSLALEYSNFGVPSAAANKSKKRSNGKKRTKRAADPTVEFVFVEPKLVGPVAAHYNLTADLAHGASTLISVDADGRATTFNEAALKRESVVEFLEKYVKQKDVKPAVDRDEL